MDKEPENLPFKEKLRNIERLSRQISFNVTTHVEKPVFRRNPSLPNTSDVKRHSQPISSSLETEQVAFPTKVKTVYVRPASTDAEAVYVQQISTDVGRQYPVQTPTDVGRQYPIQTPTDVGRQYPVQIPTDVGRQHPLQTDVGKQYPLQTPTDVGRQYPVQTPTDVGRQHPVQTPTDVGRQHPVQTPIDVGRQYPVQTPTDVGRQYPVQTPVDVGIQYPVQTSTDVGRQHPVQTSTDVGRQYPLQTPTDVGRRHSVQTPTDVVRHYALQTPTEKERASSNLAESLGLNRKNAQLSFASSNYVNTKIHELPGAQSAECKNTALPLVDGNDIIELRKKSTGSSLTPRRPSLEYKDSITCSDDNKQQKNQYRSVHKTEDSDILMKPGPDIDLLMIGKTGNGKSALGNSLLQQKAFKSKPSTTSVTKEVTFEVTERNGRKMKVVDCPGVGDTDWSKDETENFVADALADAITINPQGYHAFLLVVKFGGRFTKEDSGTVDYLKRIFGVDFVKRYCILVMTCGDLFEQEVKKLSFNEWIDREKGVLAELARECDHRVIMFDNKTTDVTKARKQLNDLVQMIDDLIVNNSRYTNEQFELAKSERHSFILKLNKPIITEDTMAECNIIIQLFKRAQDQIKNDNDTKVLEELLSRANVLCEVLVNKDDNSGVLTELIAHVHSIQNSISDEIKLCHRIAEYMENLRCENEKRLNEEIKRKSDTFDSVIAEHKKLYESEIECFKVELKKYFEKSHELEKHNKVLKTKNRHPFTAIKEKVAKTFKHKNKVKPNRDALS